MNMKHMKKLASLLLALTLVFALAATAGAENTTAHKITITNAQSGHTYTAYQVLKGDYSDGKLTNIAWGSGVNGDALLAELKSSNTNYSACTSAEDVAEVLKGFADNSSEIDAFASIVSNHLSNSAGSSTQTETPYTIDVEGDGYYFIKDAGTIAENDAATKYILAVRGADVSITAKAEVPDIDKVIVTADSNNGNAGKGTAQDVGTVVVFKVTSKVPAMDGYNTYRYIVNDTMSNGLTPVDENSDNKIDVTITIGSESYTDFDVTQNGQSFTITFKNFISQKEKAGQDIVITYSAIINENALTTDVETNKVDLEYSNNPYDNNSKGKTPPKVVYVYDFDIVVDKYTGDETTGNRLDGAKFVLYKTVGDKKQYYFYDDSAKQVKWVELADDAVAAAIQSSSITQVTTVQGAASFRGLDAGTYYLHETEAPAGYNLLKNDVEVRITATYNTIGTLASSSAKSSNNGQYQQTQQVENKSGSTLPSTGGIGTTIFYVLGGILAVTAVVLLVTKKRMNSAE